MRESSSHFEPGKWLSASPKTLLSAGRLRYFKNQTSTTGFRLFFLFVCKNTALSCGVFAVHLFCQHILARGNNPNPLRLFAVLLKEYPIGLLAGGAFAPYKRFAAGKTLAQGQFTCPEHF